MKRLLCVCSLFSFALAIQAQMKSIALSKGKYGDGPDSIQPVAVIKGLSDDQLLETVQRQTFRFFGMVPILTAGWR